MSTHDKTASGGHFAIWLLLFCIATTIALALLIMALVVGLSELFGSLIWASLAAGGIFLLAAGGIYFLTLKGPIAQLRAQVETIYDVARLLKQGYDWVHRKLDFFFRLLDELRRAE